MCNLCILVFGQFRYLYIYIYVQSGAKKTWISGILADFGNSFSPNVMVTTIIEKKFTIFLRASIFFSSKKQRVKWALIIDKIVIFIYGINL